MSTPPRDHAIVTPIHGRYLLRVPETPSFGPVRNAPMVVGFHGYGESADAHLERLEAIPELANWTLVSIQGLHRFYDRTRQVVASWMTTAKYWTGEPGWRGCASLSTRRIVPG